jgi:short-subunit dehydrogenase
MTKHKLADKVVWITGASSGIGRALTFACHEAGAKLIISSRSGERLEEVRRACRDGGEVEMLPFDLADADVITKQAELALGFFGHVDYMIHNAGVALRDRAADTALWVDRQIMQINYFGPVALTKTLLPSMLQRESGWFVVVSSLSGKYGGPQFSSYAASKHALHGFFESLRVEVHAANIRITIVVPGFVRTPIARDAITGGGGRYGKTLEVHERGMAPRACADQILEAVLRGKEEALIGGVEMYSVYLKRFFPGLLSRLMRHHPVRLGKALRRWLSFPPS